MYAESIKFSPANGSKVPSVSFDFEGQVFDHPVELGVEAAEQFQSDVEAFLVKFLKASREGDKEIFVNLYAPNDRIKMQEFVDGDLWERNVSVAKSETSAKLLAVINYGDYFLCIVVSKYNNFDDFSELVYPVLKTSSGELFMSQDLGADSFVSKYAFLLANELTNRKLR